MACNVTFVNAPNGKKSILFDSLSKEFGENEAFKTWVVTKTKTFEKEFGNSKVKDANGEPMILYRGDRPGVSKYKYNKGDRAAKLGGGIYLTADRSYAEQFGHVHPVIVNSENIQVYKNPTEFMKTVADYYGIKGIPTAEDRRRYTAEMHSKGIDIALDGFKELTIHSDTQYKIALDIKSENDVVHEVRKEAAKERNLELEQKLISFLAPFGITVEAYSSLVEKTGLDASGAADMAKKLILISQGKADLNTLPEEVGHFIYELLGKDNPLIQRLRSLAEKTNEFQAVKEQYGEVYKNDKEKLITETVGKLIGKHLVSEFQSQNENQSVLSTIQRIWERIKQLFKRADVKALYKEVESVYGELASGVLSGDTTGLSISNLSGKDQVYFDLGKDDGDEDVEENTTEEDEEAKHALLSTQKLIDKAKNVLQLKIDQISKTAIADDKKAQNIKENLEHLQKLLSGEDAKTAIVKFLLKAQSDMLSVNLKFKTMLETGEYTAKEILRYSEYIAAYDGEFLRQLIEEIEGTEEFAAVMDPEKSERFKKSIVGLHSTLNLQYKKLGIPLLAKALSKLNTNTTLSEEDIRAQLIKGKKDVRSWQRWVEVLAESPDEIIALATKLVNTTKEKGRLETLTFEQEITKKVNAFEKHRKEQGVDIGNPKKLYEIFYEKDENGNTTGRLISKKEAVSRFAEGSKDLEFYNYFATKYFEFQKRLPAQYKKGLWLPSIRQTGKEKIAMGLRPDKAAKEALLDTFTLQLDDVGFGDTLESSSNKYVPVLFHAPIGEGEGKISTEDVSYDLGNSLQRFGGMTINNAQMNSIVHELEVLKTILADRKVSKTSGGKTILDSSKIFGDKEDKSQDVDGNTTNLYKQFDLFLDMVVYGQVKNTDFIVINGKKIPKVKLADAINKYSSFRSLALNLFSGMSNLTMGKTMNFVEAHAGEWFTKKDFVSAQKEYLANMSGFISDVNKKMPESMGGQLVELFDALQEYDEYGRAMKGNKMWKRMMSSDAAFFMQKGGEHEIQTTLMYAYLKGQKIKDKNGNEATLLDAFEQVDGELKVKDNFDVSTEDVIKHSQRLKQISQKLHGVYNNQDLINAQHTWAGRMAILFRKWLYPSFKRRYGDKRYNQRLEEFEEGNYITAIKFLGKLYRGVKAHDVGIMGLRDVYKKEKGQLESFEGKNMRRTKAELVTTLAVFSLIAMLAGLDDEDEERSWIENMSLFQLHRLYGEMTMYANPIEGLKILKSPSASMSTVEGIIRLFGSTFEVIGGTAFGDGAPRYKRDTGLYNKGDLKILKDLEAMIPILKEGRAMTAPEDRLKYMLWK